MTHVVASLRPPHLLKWHLEAERNSPTIAPHRIRCPNGASIWLGTGRMGWLVEQGGFMAGNAIDRLGWRFYDGGQA